MAEEFDPYRDWLGIGEPHRPPNHYQLLGLALFEPDPYVIARAADRQMERVGRFQNTVYGAYAQQILGQLAAAKNCLLNPQTRTEYDAWLQAASLGPAAIPTAQIGAAVEPAGLPATGSAPLVAAPLARDLSASVFGPARKPSPPAPDAELIPGEGNSKFVVVAIVSLVGTVLLLLGLIFLVASRRGLLGHPPVQLQARASVATSDAESRPDLPPPVGQAAATTGQPAAQSKPLAEALRPAPAETAAVSPPSAKPQPKSLPAWPPGLTQPHSPAATPPGVAQPLAAAATPAVPGAAAKQPLALATPTAPGKSPPAADASSPFGDNLVPGGPEDQAEEQVKMSVPERAARIRARQEVRKIYRDEYGAATESGKKRSLAEKLMAVGMETRDDPETRYALFYEAREMAISAADARLLRKSIELLAKYYKVDALEELNRSLAEATEERMAAAAKKALAPLALELAGAAVVDDDYAGAERLAEWAKETAQGKDLAVVKQAGTLLERLEEDSRRYARVLEAQKILAQKPDDREANLVEGRFLCFFKNDAKSWARGLPLLAKGNDATLKALAEAELAPGRDASTPAEMVKLADLWYQAAAAVDASRRPDLLRRAAYWYRAALADLEGFTKAKCRRRLEEIQTKLAEASAAGSGRRRP